MVPWPEIMITSGGLSSSRIRSRVSRPSIPGSQMSSSTTSNVVLLSSLRQASPLSTDDAEYPSSARAPASESRIPASSSTIRTLCMLSFCHGGGALGNDRQLDDEAGADGFVLFHANGASMILHHAAHDRKPKARATFFCREIWKEKFFFQFTSDTVAGVGHRNLDGIATGHQCGGNLN